MTPRVIVLLLIALAARVAAAALADQAPDTPAHAPVVSNPMNMDEPMQGGMKKKSMKKGDVKKSADEKIGCSTKSWSSRKGACRRHHRDRRTSSPRQQRH
jgi:hypothetical protein